jgi:hypothetical protein
VGLQDKTSLRNSRSVDRLDKGAEGEGLLRREPAFLMLETGNTNLASHILAKSVARLSVDAQAMWGHDVLLAETFADTDRGMEGTSYKAAGRGAI